MNAPTAAWLIAQTQHREPMRADPPMRHSESEYECFFCANPRDPADAFYWQGKPVCEEHYRRCVLAGWKCFETEQEKEGR